MNIFSQELRKKHTEVRYKQELMEQSKRKQLFSERKAQRSFERASIIERLKTSSEVPMSVAERSKRYRERRKRGVIAVLDYELHERRLRCLQEAGMLSNNDNVTGAEILALIDALFDEEIRRRLSKNA